MTIISFDTATNKMSVALENNNDLTIDTYQSKGDRQHGEVALPIIQEIMNKNDVSISDIEQLVVGIGPGSFTGLRVGITIAKTWAETLQLPLATISSLAMMLPLKRFEEGTLYIPMMDARRQTVYSGIYRLINGKYQTLVADKHITWEVYQEVILNQVAQVSNIQRIVLIGESFIVDYVSLLQKSLNQIEHSVPIDYMNLSPQAESVFQLEFQELVKEVNNPTLLVPHYAHLTLAEQEWQDKQQEGYPSEQHNKYIEITH
ncbi:tRNA (adenosine(37)-N6)-threonylcarbamoyltransferase complex dimerization subunit type 1 TsaB [Aerococcaceae bacterium DSM 111020]|nr:tRNA (adenosine(37)-N6)-threonylcarbamoyltransferase complex dimerization subunit type 1 TsaB [Aerococcaceae bacterium DSM 111020]